MPLIIDIRDQNKILKYITKENRRKDSKFQQQPLMDAMFEPILNHKQTKIK